MEPQIKAMQQAAKRMQPTILAYRLEIEKIRSMAEPALLEIHKSTVETASKVIRWQEEKKIHVSRMAEYGWFPNWYTFFCNPKGGVDVLDDFMVSHIDEYWGDIKIKMVELCPNREHIFNAIYELHEQKNYVASIPLILTHCLLYTSPSPRDLSTSRMPSSA